MFPLTVLRAKIGTEIGTKLTLMRLISCALAPLPPQVSNCIHASLRLYNSCAIITVAIIGGETPSDESEVVPSWMNWSMDFLTWDRIFSSHKMGQFFSLLYIYREKLLAGTKITSYFVFKITINKTVVVCGPSERSEAGFLDKFVDLWPIWGSDPLNVSINLVGTLCRKALKIGDMFGT